MKKPLASFITKEEKEVFKTKDLGTTYNGIEVYHLPDLKDNIVAVWERL